MQQNAQFLTTACRYKWRDCVCCQSWHPLEAGGLFLSNS